MVAGTTLPLFPAPLAALPCHISGKTLENDKQRDKECLKYILKFIFCQERIEKISMGSRKR
jgi:hypothetical protein